MKYTFFFNVKCYFFYLRVHIQKLQLEHELLKERVLDNVNAKKRAANKALELLGHDPSAEKVNPLINTLHYYTVNRVISYS